jgi:surfactin synthase thioesterase subunit
MKAINLICLPFAGGNKYSYREYELKASSLIKVIPLEYPGRGRRIGEPLLGDMDLIVEDIFLQVKPLLAKGDYALYGHSMGGIVACLLARKIMDSNLAPPLHLFITGTTAPSSKGRSEFKRHLLGKAEFIDEIRRLGGSPDEILENEELLEYLEPILRADFKAMETFQYEEHPQLQIPFTVITGSEEKMKKEDILLWQRESAYEVEFRTLPGKHFFIMNYAYEIIELISKKIFIPVKYVNYE